MNFIQGFPVTMFDWVIQDGRRPPPGTMNPVDAFIAAGVFDAKWRQQDRWTVLRDDTRASQWTLRRAPSKNAAASPAALAAIAGGYELFPGFVLTFKTQGSGLVVDVPGQGTFALTTESDFVYVNPQTGDAAEFLRDEQGKITGASVDSNGGILLAKRVP